MWRAHFSTQFLYDILFGVAVFYNFAAVNSLAQSMRCPDRLAAPIRTLAGYTLSLYLFHTPFIELMTNVLHITRPELFCALMAVCVVLLGQLTEKRTAFFHALLASTAPEVP